MTQRIRVVYTQSGCHLQASYASAPSPITNSTLSVHRLFWDHHDFPRLGCNAVLRTDSSGLVVPAFVTGVAGIKVVNMDIEASRATADGSGASAEDSATAVSAGAGAGSAGPAVASEATDADHRKNPILGLAGMLVAAAKHKAAAAEVADSSEALVDFRKKGAHDNHPFFSYYGLLVRCHGPDARAESVRNVIDAVVRL